MKNSKLIQLLSSLSKKELEQFKEYASCSFAGLGDKPLALLQYLCRYHPNFDNPRVQKEAIFEKFFPDRAYSSQPILKKSSAIYHCLRDFLAFMQWRKNPVDQELSFLRNDKVRSLNSIYESSSKHLQKLLDNGEHETDESLLNDYLHKAELMIQYIHRDNRKLPPKFEEVGRSLDRYYIARKLRLGVEMLSAQQLFDIGYELPLLEKAQAIVKQYPEQFKDLLTVQIHALELRCLQTESKPRAYSDLLKLLDDNIERCNPAEIRMHYRFAQNYYIQQINIGKTKYTEQAFEIYKKMVDKGIILQKGMIPPSDYKNVVSIALKAGKLQWSQNFIDSHKHLLPSDQRDSIYYLSLANYFYHCEKTDEALEILRSTKFGSEINGIQARYLQVKIAYDAGEFRNLESLLISFPRFISRAKTINKERKASISNFIKGTKRMLKLRQKADTLSKSQLRDEKAGFKKYIEGLSPMNNAEWLLQKLEELKT